MGILEDEIDATMNEALNEISDVVDEENIEEKIAEKPDELGRVDEDQVGEKQDVAVDDPVIDENVSHETGTDSVAQDEEIDPSLINPPSTWRPAAKEDWKNLSKVAREEIRKREWDMTNGMSQMRKEFAAIEEKSQIADRITEITKPYQAMIDAEGATIEAVTQEMLKSAYILRTASPQVKVQMVAQLAQQHGFMNELSAAIRGTPHQQQPQNQFDPSKIDELVERKFQERQEKERREAEERQNQTLAFEIESFKNDVNEDGTLKYPYFNNVAPYMISVLENSNASLEEAYQEALWASPETRSLMLNQQQQTGQSQRTANEHREKARKAAANNLSRTHTDATEQQIRPTGSIDDTLSAVMEDIEKRTA